MLVIHEPYPVLMHHITDLEDLMIKIKTGAEDSEQGTNTARCQHLEILLNFIRPQFQKLCAPAQQRLSQAIPTVTFNDLWFLMKPGSMAYSLSDGHWIGCAIGQSSKEEVYTYEGFHNEESSEDETQSDDCPPKWSTRISLLRASSVSPRLDPVSSNIYIDKFDGEKLITSLVLFPREFHDKTDAGDRRALFEERGNRIAKIVWAGSHYARHRGYCLDDLQSYVRVIGKSVTEMRYGDAKTFHSMKGQWSSARSMERSSTTELV